MDLQDLKEKLVAVLGYGQEGKAVTGYLMKHGIKPALFDQRPWEAWDEIEKSKIRKLGLNFIFGPDCFKELAGFDVAFRSPGIKLSQLTINNLQLTSQTKWFFEHCPAKIIGITGTKGKGTTASLIYEILCSAPIYRHSGKQPINGHATEAHPKVFLTGNIGKTQALEILDNLTLDDWVVYELSSFQLQDLDRSPHIGVVLMVTQEHLDYHESADEYREAKASIVRLQSPDDFAIINADFPSSVEIGKQGKGEKLYFSREKEVSKGCFVKDGEIVINGSDFRLPASDLHLRGQHNLENVSAAILAARCAGASFDAIKNAVTKFKGLEHRLEFVGEKSGIKFYNDSFSTTPETAIAAIKSFDEPLIIVLGGSSKNSDFTELGQVVRESKNIKSVILIGQEGANIKRAISKEGVGGVKIFEGAQNMTETFSQILSVAKKGDIVLLSPACASFDMFSSYVDRGNQFKQAVKSI